MCWRIWYRRLIWMVPGSSPVCGNWVYIVTFESYFTLLVHFLQPEIKMGSWLIKRSDYVNEKALAPSFCCSACMLFKRNLILVINVKKWNNLTPLSSGLSHGNRNTVLNFWTHTIRSMAKWSRSCSVVWSCL